MKNKTKISFILSVACMAALTSCNKLLEEQPRSQIVPQIFSTPQGLLGGIGGTYSDMRNLWGTEGFTNMVVGGTDEVLVGGSGNANFFTYNIVNSDVSALWQIAYQDINTLNGVLLYGATANLDQATRVQYLAQAKFMRAFYYFHLVQTYGDVPLHTEYITTPSSADSRQPIADVYTQIIKDLTEASAELPATPTAPFTGKAATQSVAKYLLAKVYLTRGWSTAADANDFKNAYTIASDLITNKATYGIDLWQDYADVNKLGNEYGKEVLFVVDRESDLKYGERTTGSRASGSKENGSCFFFRPNYPTITSDLPAPNNKALMTRDIANGRPFIRVRPNGPYIINQAFADRVNDSRFDNTFQTVWISNTAGVSTSRGSLTVGKDTAIWTPPFEVTDDQRNAFKGVIITPNGTSASKASWRADVFPSMKKYDDPSRADVNDASTRPFILFKFSEVYLIAAEAYFKAGDNTNAAAMLNVIRQRAAYKASNSAGQNTAAVTAMTITPGDVTLDFILDERTRELYGESLRWWDLVRTKSLSRRLNLYNSVEAYPKYSVTNPADAFSLRPIPQAEIDLITEGPKFPQNSGY